MSVDRLPTYSVAELNTAIGSLLERGFAPRFLLEATVSRPQLKKGHLWLTLTDGAASISGVVWASKLAQLSYRPEDGDGVTVVGKLNFWAARASLTVQALDIRPSLSTVLRDFERVRQLLEEQGVIDPSRQRRLPSQPSTIAVLTSVPSSALADMLRTAAERWPLTQLIVVPIPVQGAVASKIVSTLEGLAERSVDLGIQALVLARGGGSREDLAVFDDETLCRVLANYPVPVVTGLGHEDDLTVADLVADHRAATPTAAIVALLPDRDAARQGLVQRQSRLREALLGRILRERQRLQDRAFVLQQQAPLERIRSYRHELAQKQLLLKALSPERWLKRGLALISNTAGDTISDLQSVKIGDQLNIRMSDGTLEARVDQIQRSSPETTS
ncbi:exodeoxyribonuclease VII large subunit [Synechococcus sp. HB1133]|uniref:exodeoxyribonuclease VII large subunit n=1 Tax=unclassified Synechococcus TaxID=2626047 RepID=UPI00140D474B|nr:MULTISPECIES: exodeoxyribonuclease VII large subunit [unclassified Synechococcus]MCB4393390.1 exodeoxyribonuclease VII large subunit [Synechococcus sp. PH41509]MCB4423157.1 exodeoxyribonuclease VII large subunit [Synechococcus sp. HB1133]MCB4430645.1 exodeoxyribonuclease VII large subunit [Synechococcus sp. HBA1120]NHI82105.1 exodeoxyribonuclease VII large subunit [Synechococcus sp. HB1133]